MSYTGKGLFTQATSGLSSAFTALAGENSNTITLQADGDPTTFNMSLRVLRNGDKPMMRLIKYDLSQL